MIVDLPKTEVDWSPSEKIELRRLHAAFFAPRYEVTCCYTEEGDPWCVVHDSVQDAMIVHIARIGRRYIVVHPKKNISRTVAQIKTAVDLAVQ